MLTHRIVMTFAGLYMYDRAKMEVARGERKVQRIEYKEKHLLPLDTSDLTSRSQSTTPDLYHVESHNPHISATSATEITFSDAPRRRSLSFNDPLPLPLPQNGGWGQHGWGLGNISEMTPPVTPRTMTPQPYDGNAGFLAATGGRRRYSGSSFGVVEGKLVNGSHKSYGEKEGGEFDQIGIEEKASWE
jgi:hypothetical protein